jgi:hypothetical protein
MCALCSAARVSWAAEWSARATLNILKSKNNTKKQSATGANLEQRFDLDLTEAPGTLAAESIDRVKGLHAELEKLEDRGRKCGLEYAETARQLGRALLDLQDELKHGEKVGAILRAVPGLALATAYRYMRLAEKYPDAGSLAAALAEEKTLAALYGHIARPGSKRKLEETGGEPDALVDAVQVSLSKSKKSVNALATAVSSVCQQDSSKIGTNEIEQIREIWKTVTMLARDVDAINEEEILSLVGAETEGGAA